jgi:hypothetical protein
MKQKGLEKRGKVAAEKTFCWRYHPLVEGSSPTSIAKTPGVWNNHGIRAVD